MNIGENIKSARKSKGITQKELAEKIGKSYSVVQKYELGLTVPPLAIVYKIAEALEIPIDVILANVDILQIDKDFQNQILGALDKMQNVSEVFNQAIQDRDAAYSESSEYIVDYYNMLNKKGKIEATKRTSELTQIEEYTKPDEE